MADRGAGSAWPPSLLAAYASQRLALVRLAFLITGDRQAAEDIVQEAFLATRTAGDRVREPGPYLRVAVVNGSRSLLRRRGVERRRAEAAPETTTSAPDEMWDALGRLNERQRTAVVLRYYEALPDAEIAAVLGCREATVRTTIHRALAALRKEIQR